MELTTCPRFSAVLAMLSIIRRNSLADFLFIELFEGPQSVTGNDEQSTTQETNQFVSESQSGQNVDHKDQTSGSLRAVTNCTTPHTLLNVLTNSHRDILLVFSALGDNDARHMTSVTCHVRLKSQQRYVISAVLLEHSICGGGVFVLLWDNTTRIPWDVCSVWQVPGPDVVTSSNVADVSIELVHIRDPCDLNISIMAVEKTSEGHLELRYLSTAEGTAFLSFFSLLLALYLFLFVCWFVYCFVCFVFALAASVTLSVFKAMRNRSFKIIS